MAPPSSVPPIEFTEAGLVIPEESKVLEGVQEDIDAAFGGGSNPALETPQGQLASSQAAVIGDKNNEFAFYVNQVDPQYAEGRFQDAIGRIYFLDRNPATSTVVTCTVVGQVGGSIAAGTLVKDTSGNIYSSVGEINIPSTGSISADFQNIETGPIPCPSGTLTVVYQASAIDTITNPTDGALGADVESRASFEERRKASVALNGRGTTQAIYANVLNVDGIIDAYVIDNPTGATVNTGETNFPVVKNSVYVAVVGGTDADIAQAIWDKKDLGCNYNGNTTETVIDDAGYSFPQPSYEVSFERPAALPILFAVQIVDDPSLPSNIEDLVKDAIIAKFNGTDGTTRERIASLVLASKYYGPVTSVADNVAVINILIGKITATLTQVQVGIDQSPSITSTDITVTLV